MISAIGLSPKYKKKIKAKVRQQKIDVRELLPPPQPGGQTKFYNTEADICIFGGAAGSGKSRALLLKAVKHIENSGYGAVLFRRTSPEITTEGGLWDESVELYSKIPGARSRESKLDWIFSSGASISFGHAQYEKDVENKYPGSQIAYIGFDELTKFTQKQFWFLFSRNRTACGIKPRIDATCNPDADSWVKDLIQWWIDLDTGLPIKERSGVLRYFYRIDEKLHWGDSKEELVERFPKMAAIAPPKSLTFIPGTIYENKALLDANPQYLSNLLALRQIEKARLLDGNWNVRDINDCLFNYVAIQSSLKGDWEQPIPGHVYIGGVDPNFGGSDFFTTHIYDVTSYPHKLVAEFHESNRSVSYSIQQSQILFDIYQPFAVAIEGNGGGVVVAEKIKFHDVRVVQTSQRNKLVNTDRIALLIEQGMIVFPSDWDGSNEFKNFSLTSRCALTGHDDRVMCCAIASTLFDEVEQIYAFSGDGLGFTSEKFYR